MKRIIYLAILFFVISAVHVFGQSKTKITMTVEKDSIKIEELAKLIADIQKLEKKWKLDIKIEFEKKVVEERHWLRLYGGTTDTINLMKPQWNYNNNTLEIYDGKVQGATTLQNRLPRAR